MGEERGRGCLERGGEEEEGSRTRSLSFATFCHSIFCQIWMKALQIGLSKMFPFFSSVSIISIYYIFKVIKKKPTRSLSRPRNYHVNLRKIRK